MKAVSQRKPGRPASQAIRTRRREEILEAAAKLFAEHGYSDTATRGAERPRRTLDLAIPRRVAPQQSPTPFHQAQQEYNINEPRGGCREP